MDNSTKKLFHRIKHSPDGSQFLQLLRDEEQKNYQSFLRSASAMNEHHKGYGACLHWFLRKFEECEAKIGTVPNPFN